MRRPTEHNSVGRLAFSETHPGSRGRKHHGTQIWGSLHDSMGANRARAGLRVLVMSLPEERMDGLHVLRVYVVRPTVNVAA